MSRFKKATLEQAFLRMAIIGPSGSGKTWTALLVACGLVPPNKRVACLDSEHGTAKKYSKRYDFDHDDLLQFSPDDYARAIVEAERDGFGAIVIDSLSHAWMGKGGALEQVDNHVSRDGGNKFAAWRHVTPKHNNLIETMLGCKMHLIVTMRSKTEYVVEEDDRGKKVPRKVGLAPIQRDGLEYEFDVVGEMNHEHDLAITKSRCEAIDGLVMRRPGEDLVEALSAWLLEGAAPGPTLAERLESEAIEVGTREEFNGYADRVREAWDRFTPAEQERLRRARRAILDRIGNPEPSSAENRKKATRPGQTNGPGAGGQVPPASASATDNPKEDERGNPNGTAAGERTEGREEEANATARGRVVEGSADGGGVRRQDAKVTGRRP